MRTLLLVACVWLVGCARVAVNHQRIGPGRYMIEAEGRGVRSEMYIRAYRLCPRGWRYVGQGDDPQAAGVIVGRRSAFAVVQCQRKHSPVRADDLRPEPAGSRPGMF